MCCFSCKSCLKGVQKALTSIFAALKRDLDDDGPRPPPPPATPVDFPCCEPSSADTASRETQDLFKLFGEIHKGPSKAHLDALNVSLRGNTPIEELVPADQLPPKSWLSSTPTPSQISSQQPILINGSSLPAHETFYARQKELQISNENGYRTIHRVPLTGKETPVRLVFFRKFWEELDYIADYWDTSRDKYTKSRSTRQDANGNSAIDQDELRQIAQDPGGDDHNVQIQAHDQADKDDVEMQDIQQISEDSTVLPDKALESPNENNNLAPDQAPQANDSTSGPSQPDVTAGEAAEEEREEAEVEEVEELYTGRRNSTGSHMPPQHREKALFAFIEAIALPFRLRLSEPRSQPKLQLAGCLLIPTPHMASIHRLPLDQTQARQGLQEGPVMGAVSADYSRWREDTQAKGEGGAEQLHLLKELACVLLLAQRRAREGREEEVPGKGKWWAEKRRWGGGSGVAVFKDPAATTSNGGTSGADADADADADGTVAGQQARRSGASGPSLIEAQRRRVKRARRSWAAEQKKSSMLAPPCSLWERNVRYLHIGMDRSGGDGNEVDDIYLISSVNHHLSILHARVHTKYIEYVTTGGGEGGNRDLAQQREPWYRLEMQRSRWYDFLDAGDRVEAMRGVWGVLNWLMRE